MIERPTSVAGTFYPADPHRLGPLVESMLDAAAGFLGPVRPSPAAARRDGVAGPEGAAGPEGVPLGLIVPHAGLMYSGAVAAVGWACVAAAGFDTPPSTIVLAGTDHEARSPGIAVWTGGPWRSPLGDVPIDGPLARRIVGLGRPFAADDVAHLGEHSLEVQLPFVACAMPAARIVPLLVSPRLHDHTAAGQLLGALLGELLAGGERVALVASSDFAHYPPHGVARQVDARLLEPIRRLDATELFRLERAILATRQPGLACGLCGIDPVRVTLTAVAAMGATRGVVLRAATSADAGGDPRRTVGYATVAFLA